MLLLLKLLITPFLTGIITFIERRFGPHVAGILIGLPLTSGPISLFLATEQGTRFSSNAAMGTMSGITACGAFCVAYAWSARNKSWLPSLIIALLAFTFVVIVLPTSTAGFLPMLSVAMVALSFSWLAVNQISKSIQPSILGASQDEPPVWNLIARISIATISIMAVTATSGSLGPQLSGILSSIPILSAILIGFSHAREGNGAAIVLIRGLIGGCFPALAFFAMINLLQHFSMSIAATYSIATVVTLSLSSIIGWFTQPQRATFGSAKPATT